MFSQKKFSVLQFITQWKLSLLAFQFSASFIKVCIGTIFFPESFYTYIYAVVVSTLIQVAIWIFFVVIFFYYILLLLFFCLDFLFFQGENKRLTVLFFLNSNQWLEVAGSFSKSRSTLGWQVVCSLYDEAH